MEVLAKNIRSLRQQYGWSQGDVAGKLGISIPAFSKIETGVTDVNLSRLEQIASVFAVALTDLLSADDIQADIDLKLQLEVEAIAQRVQEREIQISALQKKVIVLYEELRKKQMMVVAG